METGPYIAMIVLNDMNTLVDTLNTMNKRFGVLMDDGKYSDLKQLMKDRGQIVDALASCEEKFHDMPLEKEKESQSEQWKAMVELAQVVEEKLLIIKEQDKQNQERLQQCSDDVIKELNALQTGKDAMHRYTQKDLSKGKTFTA
jgi:gas vesicle protein